MTPKYNNYCIAARYCARLLHSVIVLMPKKKTIVYDIQTPTRPPAKLSQIPQIRVTDQPGQGSAP